MRFYSVDTLTGRMVGELFPSKWELGEPLRSPGTGSLTFPLDTGLSELILHRRRWVAAEDGGRVIWCGPVPRRPQRTGGEVIVPLVDWRSWFYRAPIRPLADGTRRDYIKTGANAREQALIMTDLLGLALDAPGAPKMVIDTAPVTGVTREITALMLDRSTGEYLESVSARGGCEWHVYATQSDPTTMLLHAAVDWPERQHRTEPVKLEWRQGQGGNVAGYTWPEGEDSPTKVWAVGEGEPPDQVWASDEYPDIADGTDVLWEQVLGPLDGVSKSATAFDHAEEAIARARGFEGLAQFTVTAEQLALSSVDVGDRARVVLSYGWIDVDLPACRIVDRVISGGRGEPTVQMLTVDLSDPIYPGDPGEDVPEDE